MNKTSYTTSLSLLLLFSNTLTFSAENQPPPDTPGRRVYIDPATGRRGVPPPGHQGPIVPSSAPNPEAKLVPVKTKPGGFKVHLGDPFQATKTATNAPPGKTAVRSVNGPESPLKQVPSNPEAARSVSASERKPVSR